MKYTMLYMCAYTEVFFTASYKINNNDKSINTNGALVLAKCCYLHRKKNMNRCVPTSHLRFCCSTQEDLQVAVSQGGRLLDCIKEPIHADPDYNMTCDEVENLATVQR